SYLKRMPIDALKIDRSFIKDLTTSPDSAAIVHSIIDMAHNMKMCVVAEGVETEAQLAHLVRYQCDAMQGFFFSKPLAVDKMTQTLEEGRCLDTLQPGALERTLLILDDEADVVNFLKSLFIHEGYRILTAACAKEAFHLLANNAVGVIVADQRLPGMSGAEFLHRVKKRYPDTIRIILTGYADLATMADAINKGAIYKFFTKPCDNEQLRANIREAFEYYELRRDNKRPTRKDK
ncbi:MAG: EAL domain-containing protein, partial [Nitrospiria bacterium]